MNIIYNKIKQLSQSFLDGEINKIEDILTKVQFQIITKAKGGKDV